MKDEIILITGGTSGIGKSLVRNLYKNNTVIVCGRNQEKLDLCKNGIDFLQFTFSGDCLVDIIHTPILRIILLFLRIGVLLYPTKCIYLLSNYRECTYSQ